MKYSLTFLLICLVLLKSLGQETESAPATVYKINHKSELPITIGMLGLNFLGMNQLDKKPPLDTAEVFALDQNDVWVFDRIVFNQSYPASESVYTISDLGLWIPYVAPALLFIDNKISKDWKDITLMYFETQAINYNLYVWTATFTKRIRPLVYIDDPVNDFRFEKTTTDSFFSGHASMTAGASFFIAKVLNDYHPEWGSKRSWLFIGAMVPPSFVGYLRYRGFLHFPTDVLLGIGVGAAVGTLVPHLHKITSKMDSEVSILPFTGIYSGTGISLSMSF
jgi:membrane-associated phospholipid phosphatase